MGTAGQDRNDVWTSIFRRKGKNGSYTRLFADLASTQRDALLKALELHGTELPVIGSVETPHDWFALTTERVIWSIDGARKELSVGEIEHASANIRTAEQKKNLRDLQIATLGGGRHFIELETGAPLMGVWSILLNIARRNRGARRKS